MLVMLIESLPASGRGFIRRWLQELRAGVFLGHASALVRDELWLLFERKYPDSGVIQVWPASNEQRFEIRMRQIERISVTDLDGLKFITLQDAAWQEACELFRLKPSQE
jgi:CRISPR-associated protein Cas2